MAKKPTEKPEARDGEGAGVDDSGSTAAAAPAATKRAFTSQTRVSLTELNASAQKAHREQRDVQKLAAEAAARAIASVVARTG
jgi:hypothetical protein